VADRFWAKVDREGPLLRPELGKCWVWTASTNQWGYGQFNAREHQCTLAHRFAWRLSFGDAKEMCVLHKCDNPRCVNPDHLFLGTRTENAADKVRKHRQSRISLPGSRNPIAKLSEEQVTQMRALARSGVSGAELGRRFSVSKSTACRAIRGALWRHVA
jgi:hypothetical protein